MFDHYPQYQEWYARVQLVFFMLGMGVNLAVDDFVRVARRPRSFFLGIIGQVCVIPFVALGVSLAFGLTPPIALGLILVSAMPGGTLSKVLVYLGRGNAPLSITLTAVTTLGTLVTVPVTLHLLAAAYVPADFEMPHGVIITDVVLFLLAPLALGMFVGRLWPTWRHALGRWCVRLGFVTVTLMVFGSLASGLMRPGEYGLYVPVAIIVFCLAGQQLNMLPFYLLRLPRADRFAVGIEVTTRNMNLALLLHASLFAANPELGGGVLFVIFFYAAAAMGAGLPLALNHRRLSRRERLPPLPAQEPRPE